MKTLLMMPIIAAFIMIVLCCLAHPAHASDFITFDNPGMTREERIIKNLVDKGRKADKYTKQALSIHVQGKCIANCVKPIDGREDSIEISSSRTSLPDEFLAMPTSKERMKQYVGR